MAIELKTYGDLKKVVNAIKAGNRKEMIISKGKEIALDTLLGFIGAGAVKSGVELAKAAFNAPDTKKTNTWLDKLNIDDEVSKIVDDTVENGYVDALAKDLEQKPDNESLPADFDINKELQKYLAQNYKNRTVAGIEENKKIAIRLKKETSITGTGASVTPGTGEGVATKYAFGKTNKVKPEGWEDAPSVPNRKSKAMDYKELWEGELKLGVKYDYKGDSGFISTGGSNDPKDWKFLGNKGKYPYLSVKADLVPSEKQPEKYDGAFDLGMGKGHHIDEAENNGTDEILAYLQAAKEQGKLSPDAQQVLIQWMNSPGASREEIIKVLRQLTGVYLNENYNRFRNETKTRTKPEQFHTAVKEVKKKVNEINRLFEYMNRLQSELSESEGGLKYKKYTEKALQQIKESTKQLFFKSTKLK